MAHYHCSVKVGAKGHAQAHMQYVARLGRYSSDVSKRYEDLAHSDSGNMPSWAANPDVFWGASDKFERANGSTYRELEFALPRELLPEQRVDLVHEVIRRSRIADLHPWQYGIHVPKAALASDGLEQPHVHLCYSERTLDGIERGPDEFFKRYNAKNPERGGCKKSSDGTPDRLQELREIVANVTNEFLRKYDHEDRVDHRSYASRGIALQPEKHFGPRLIKELREQGLLSETKAKLLELRAERRAAIKAHYEANDALSFLEQESRLSEQAETWLAQQDEEWLALQTLTLPSDIEELSVYAIHEYAHALQRPVNDVHDEFVRWFDSNELAARDWLLAWCEDSTQPDHTLMMPSDVVQQQPALPSVDDTDDTARPTSSRDDDYGPSL